MGVFVGLRILPSRISDEEWSSFYSEARYFLTNCPSNLAALHISYVECVEATYKRYSYSKNLEIAQNNEPPFLRVDGTFDGLYFAETFIIPSSIKSMRERLQATSKDDAQEALFSINAATVFLEKTQGYPYHYAILALGILAESHFPERALAVGDITPDQAEISRTMLKHVFKRNFSQPLTTDAAALYAFFLQHNDPLTAFDKTEQHFRCEDAKKMQKLAAVVDRELLERWQKKQFCECDPKTVGMTSSAILWLNATADLAGLLRILTLDEDGPMLSQERCASILASTGIALDPSYAKKIEFIRVPSGNKGTTDTVFTMLGHVVMLWHGFTCQHAQHCLGEQAVLDAASATFPYVIGEFQSVLTEENKKLRKTIDYWYKKFQSVSDDISKDSGILGADSLRSLKPCVEAMDETTDEATDEVKKDEADDSSDSPLTPLQKKSLEDMAQTLKPAVQEIIEECKKMTVKYPSHELSDLARSILCRTAAEQYTILPESTWKRIDAEHDFQKLCCYTALVNDRSALKESEMVKVIVNNSELSKIVIGHILGERRRHRQTRKPTRLYAKRTKDTSD
ncbi:MAG: hypothetical protein IJU76_06680 [Desulfovibrionaceae bacterium]|nr:hypothetical protein [Desulfovibrionaceae bacterium]